jgi:hypothetical protein
MALAKHKETARENEGMLPHNLKPPSVFDDDEETEATAEMMNRLMDESWEWEKKFQAMTKKYEDEKEFARMFFDPTDKKEVANKLTRLQHQSRDIAGWLKNTTTFMKKNAMENTRSRDNNPWDSYRKARAICERYGMDKMWDETTDEFSARPQLSNLGKFVRRRVDHGNYQETAYDFKYTTREWLENLEDTIINTIQCGVRDAGGWCISADIIIAWAIETPGYRRAQALCIAKDIAKGEVYRTGYGAGNSHNYKRKHLKMKDMKWLGLMCGVSEESMKGKKKANLQAYLVGKIRGIVAQRYQVPEYADALYGHYGHATAERYQIDRLKCDWY